MAVDPEQLRRGVEFLAKNPPAKGRVSAGSSPMAASHPADTAAPLEITAVRADGWLGDLLSGAAAQSLQPLAHPRPSSPRYCVPTQQRGLSWLAFLSSLGLGTCLADDMGLGKTVPMLALECVQRHDEPDTGPTLLLCPMSLVGNWQREAAKFAPTLRVYAHHGGARLRGDALREHLADTDIMVTTYATATRDIDELAGFRWNRVVLDEAQAVKNSLSRGAKAVRRLEAAHRVALTGTPVETGSPSCGPSWTSSTRACSGPPRCSAPGTRFPVEKYGQTEPAERLRKHHPRPYILRRLKSDPTIIDDLPEKIEIKQYCQLTTERAHPCTSPSSTR